ncbi:hypothetical protein F5Y14DRAFT_432786 [Nemania sp. NC0429]|nr:hypothetical protein F5Y14DRAFT_432786 [Nemania sp. NC0429]
MSDQSGLEEDDGLSLTDPDLDESESEQDNGFFDLEADESDSHHGDEHEDDEEEDDDNGDGGDDRSHASKTCFFPQFSLLPPELRNMIWEAVDPDLKSPGRVFDFILMEAHRPFWASATLAQQTAPARALLSASKESRSIALAHYPDTIDLGSYGVIRFRSSSDIILLRTRQYLRKILINLERWCPTIRYLAFSANDVFMYRTPADGPLTLPKGCRNLEAFFYCWEADELGPRRLDWSVSKFARHFYREAYEETPLVSEQACPALYCWPDTTLQADLADFVMDGSRVITFPPGIPVWPMVEYSFESGLELYRKVKRYAERSVEPGATSSPESSEGESIYESELDDYALDDFVVESSPEESEESSSDEPDEVNIHGANGSGEHDDSFSGNESDGGSRVDHYTDAFTGFSPLQDPSDDETTGDLPNTTQAIDEEAGSLENLESDASSLEEEPRAARRTGRRKRQIVSSDDEGDGENRDELAVESNSRGTKRVRAEVSTSDDGEDDGGESTGSEIEVSFRSKKRARTIVLESEDAPNGEAEKDEKSEGEEEDDDEDDDEDDEDDDEEEPRASRPTSLFAKLRQFRSEVRVSPENESSNSGEEYDEEERYESDEEEEVSDVEFPESAEEDGEADGW